MSVIFKVSGEMGKVHVTKHLAFFWVVNDSTVHCAQGLNKAQSGSLGQAHSLAGQVAF